MSISLDPENDWKNKIADQILKDLLEINKLQGNSIKKMGGVSKSMLKKSRLNFDKIEKCK